MKITLISTSARKNSNSLRFVSYLRNLLVEEGQHEVSIIDFEEYDIPFVGQGTVKKDNLTPFQDELISAWEAADLLHLVRTFEGCFVARYKRKQAPPGTAGHAAIESTAVAALSNHSFGSAFDINFIDNMLGEVPAQCGQRGATRELVEAANALGIYWGGHFNTQDGMHFEISAL